MLTAILAKGEYSLTPDVRYSSSTPILATTLDDTLKELCRVRGNVYIWSEKFSTRPPCMIRVSDGENAGKYSVDMSKDGPGLELQLPPCYEKDKSVHLAPGHLWYQKRTKNMSTRLWEPATQELKAGFKEVRGVLHQHLTSLTHDTTTILVGMGVKHLVEEGVAVIHGLE